ncbi:MAG: response regulator transcription factor [Planctomycetes bacterium]|nr:response regulator transcription factor [Planctomycetota bacterium]
MATELKSRTNNGRRTATVLVVDDHPIVRQGLRMLIASEEDLDVCGEAGSVDDAIRSYHDLKPDLVVADISLSDGSGVELVKELTACDPSAKILVASMHDETLFAERVLRAGAKGYINKDEATERLVHAIRQVLEGRVYLSDRMTERILCRAVGGEHETRQAPVEALSDRELEVFEQIGRGVTTRQIADKLHLSPKTVETYRENIKTKLNLKNATELTRHAVQWVLENT